MTAIEFQTQLLDLKSSLDKFAFSLTLKKADAEDLVQETCLKVLIYKDRYVFNANFKAWTHTIMRNIYINNFRRNQYKYKWYDNNEESFSQYRSKAMGSDNPDSVYSVMEMTKHVDQLKEPFRIPFKMYLHGFKYQEIADKLKLNIGTVKSRIHLSRKQLMDQLDS